MNLQIPWTFSDCKKINLLINACLTGGTCMKKKLFLLFSLLLGAFTCNLAADEQKLIVIRHGEAASNTANIYNSNPDDPAYKAVDLTEKGKQQALKTAKDLQSQGFNDDNIIAVFVSPLPRTRQTAEPLVQLGLITPDKIIVDKRITETQAGDLEGKTQLPAWTSAVAQEHHGETEDQVRSRVQDFYNFILKEYPEGNIIVVTHGLAGQNLIDIASNQKVKLGLGEGKVVPLRGNQK
jgi:broad specificity phosphatase PhoE